MKKIYDIIIVGAGASGLVAAISATKVGAKVLILEHMEAAGKKLLSTGNGKCNFTNQGQGVEFYRGQDPAFVIPVLEQFGLEDTLVFFRDLGLRITEKRDGYYYPANGQATAVREVLLMELERRKVEIHFGIGIRGIKKAEKTFLFDTKEGQYESRACILATGGKASKKTGSDGSGIPYVKGFGHKVIPFEPALVPLLGKSTFWKQAAGVRAETVIRLLVDGEVVAQDVGEIQFTDYGISGIPTFQVSRFAVMALKEGKKPVALLDFANEFSEEELEGYLQKSFWKKYSDDTGSAAHGTNMTSLIYAGITVAESLIGFLNSKLIAVILQETDISAKKMSKDCKPEDVSKIARAIKAFPIEIIGSKSFDFAQVCAGGVDTMEVNAKTLESKLVDGLYFAGELLDIDGMCGGHNLQWAWSSGWVAGKSAAKEIKK